MSGRGRRQVDAATLSFLDVVCCGFGAIVLLLVISEWAEPVLVDDLRAELDATVTELDVEAQRLHDKARALAETLTVEQQQLLGERQALLRLQRELDTVTASAEEPRLQAQAQRRIERRLEDAVQELTEEMERLLGRRYRRPESDAAIAGVPVDSEYIIFVIDTSGSMVNYGWDLVIEKLSEVLDVYPEVKGIQVMNDMGEYMFSQYAGRWIADTPARRQAILRRLRSWHPFSNSSPVEGITEAISTFYAPDKKISLYVFGDEFSQGSIEEVVREVDRINREDAHGSRRVRIHAVGFPVQFAGIGPSEATGVRFAALMRTLCWRNGGTFVGLNRIVP